MSVYKDTKNNTWKVYYRFTDWQGKVHQSTKRGFPTKREAPAWEREQLHKVEADLDMTFESFIDTLHSRYEEPAEREHLAHQGAYHPPQTASLLRKAENEHNPAQRHYRLAK